MYQVVTETEILTHAEHEGFDPQAFHAHCHTCQVTTDDTWSVPVLASWQE